MKLLPLLIAALVVPLFYGPVFTTSVRATPGTPTLEVVSPGYGSNITSTTQLDIGTQFRVDVNVSSLGPITGFDITLNYRISFSPQFQSPIQTDRTQVSLSTGLFDGTGVPGGCSVLEAVKQVYGDPINTIRLAEVFVGGCSVLGEGRLFSVVFTVSSVDSTSLDILRASGGRIQQMIVGPAPDFGPIPGLQVLNAYFRNKPGIPPNPSFTFSPSNPEIGNTVTFNATQSVDPDNPTGSDHGIQQYLWAWGDLSPLNTGNSTLETHLFLLSGTTPGSGWFQVRLVVIDADDGIANRTSSLVFIDPGAFHNVATTIAIDRTVVNAGEAIHIAVTVENLGNRDEHVNLNVTMDYSQSPVISVVNSIELPFTNPRAMPAATFNYTVDTRGFPSRAYTITSRVALANVTYADAFPVDNVAQVSFVIRRSHDVGVKEVSVSPRVALSTQTVDIRGLLTNSGGSSEDVNVTAYYGTRVAGSLTRVHIEPSSSQVFSILWDTDGVSAGNYTISVTVFLATDENPSDNNSTDGTITILPPPSLTITPTSGPPGTQIQLQGSGFPSPSYGTSLNEVIVSFDDQFLGLAVTRDGQFTLTFNVPLSQIGAHSVKVRDATGARASASFQVTTPPPKTRIDLQVDQGSVYFPGDTAVIFVLASVNGQPTSVSSLQIILARPDGSNLTLNPVRVMAGEWKASFAVPTRGSIGTYSITVMAHQSGLIDGVALSVFEVKPTWLQGHSSTVAAALALVGIVGVGVVYWKTGYFKTSKKDSPKPKSLEV